MKNNKFTRFFKRIFEGSLGLLFPDKMKCIFCGDDVPDFENKPYCHNCEKEDIFNNHSKRCKFCDAPIYSEDDICDFCKTNHPVYDKAFCPLLYKTIVRSAILKFKDDDAKYLAAPFGDLVVKRLQEQNITVDLIIPVPSHEKTVKKRGYNQAELLANEIGQAMSIPVENDIVRKVKLTSMQKSLNYNQRQQNLYDSFKVQNLSKVKDKNVLIVDDILTTGATANAISRLIKKKANNIYVACVARRDIVDSKPKNKKKIKILTKR